MTSRDRIAAEIGALLGARSVEHRPNPTGAGKLAFVAHLPDTRLWVRVAADAAEDAALVRWAELDRRLRAYAAPPLWRRLAVAGRTALVFPVLTEVERRVDADEVLAVLARLHADRGLAAALGPPVTARASFTSVWLDRFRADLEVVGGYVAPDVLVWMTEEVEAFAALLAAPAFDEPVHAAIHGDPGRDNVLVGTDRWWLLDWEDLAVGDPVVDESIVAPGRGDSPRHRVGHRAVMLDAAVDGAADWVEHHDPGLRAAAEASYLRAIEEYERAWG